MSITKQLVQENTIRTEVKFNLITAINNKIEAEKENAIGLAVVLIMIGTMIASITAALAIHKTINYVPLLLALVLAMGANAAAISQRSFKTIAWAFIFNIVGNIFLIIYQLI